MNPENMTPQNPLEKSMEVETQEKKLIKALNSINVTHDDALDRVKDAIDKYHVLNISKVKEYQDLIDDIIKTFAEISELPENNEDSKSDLYAKIKDNVLDICYVVDEQEEDTDTENEIKNTKCQMVDKIREKVEEIVAISMLS